MSVGEHMDFYRTSLLIEPMSKEVFSCHILKFILV